MLDNKLVLIGKLSEAEELRYFGEVIELEEFNDLVCPPDWDDDHGGLNLEWWEVTG